MQIVLDVTRFVSRIGTGFDTGIDRTVRAAINDSFDRFEHPLYIAKIGKRVAILNRFGMQHLQKLEEENNWPNATGTDRFRRKLPPIQRQVRTAIKSCATKTVLFNKISNFLGDLKFIYANLGHSNLSSELFTELKKSGHAKCIVLIHDLIPFDAPQYCRADTLGRFERHMRSVSQHADLVVCNSKYTQARVKHHFPKLGRLPETKVAYLGHTKFKNSDPEPMHFDAKHSFLALGTIEPRKNISLLLDVWQQLKQELPTADMPNLLIVGRRGWESTEFFTQLGVQKKTNQHILEFNDFDDAKVQSAIKGSTALLFPSLAEGYGLPAQEALALGTPVICSNIPVFQELFAGQAEFLDPMDTDAWVESIKSHLFSSNTVQKPIKNVQDLGNHHNWDTFFNSFYGNIEKETK